jgi:uncharacterized membrane protein
MQLSHSRAVLLTAALVAAAAVHTATQSTPRSTYNSTRGVALDGYDVVAYFTAGKPIRGQSTLTVDWQGTVWRFATAANRDAFASAPDKYAPQFGGFCAYGVSRGYAVDIDPDAWSIVDGKLYLNYSKSVQRTWEKDRTSYIEKARVNWPAIAAKQAGQEQQ